MWHFFQFSWQVYYIHYVLKGQQCLASYGEAQGQLSDCSLCSASPARDSAEDIAGEALFFLETLGFSLVLSLVVLSPESTPGSKELAALLAFG